MYFFIFILMTESSSDKAIYSHAICYDTHSIKNKSSVHRNRNEFNLKYIYFALNCFSIYHVVILSSSHTLFPATVFGWPSSLKKLLL